MIGLNTGSWHSALPAYLYAQRLHPASQAPVAPVPPVRPVREGRTVYLSGRTPASGVELPAVREGADPAEMAVRGRIQYLDPAQAADAAPAQSGAAGQPQEVGPGAASAPGQLQEPLPGQAEESQSPQETMEEAECQTCKERKYQDGSDDPGVSFKTPTNIAPEQAASAVRGHEMEHVSREQAKADREGRKVVNQSVTIHTAICPECGDVYVSGGTTRTTTKADNRQNPSGSQEPQRGFEAVA